MSDVLQYYRRHGGNTSHWIMARTSQVSRWDLARLYSAGDARSAAVLRLASLERMAERLAQAQLATSDDIIRRHLPDAISGLQREKKIVQGRIRVLDQPRRIRALYALVFWLHGGYRFFGGWKSLAKDLLS